MHLAILLLLLGSPPVSLQANPPPTPHLVHSNDARQVYLDKKSLSEKNSGDLAAAWQYAKACFDYADFSTQDSQRESLALQGIKTARHAIQLDPASAQGHYTLALNLGQLARTRTLTALQLVQEMEREFLKAIQLDPKIDHAGPHRALGILYRDAPGWPVSLGNRKKAQTHLQKAINLFPQYPGNTLSFLECLQAQGQDDQVCRQIPASQRMLDQARQQLTGPAWAASWAEWDARWSDLRRKIPCQP
jgi:tetratricopeptide (TPR) repeat protein